MARVLVVDDDPLMAELCRDILTGAGHEVGVVCGQAELERGSVGQGYDLVLLTPGREVRLVKHLAALLSRVWRAYPWIVLHPRADSPLLRKVARQLGVPWVVPRGGSVRELLHAVQMVAEHRPWPQIPVSPVASSEPAPFPAPERARSSWSRAIDAVLAAA